MVIKIRHNQTFHSIRTLLVGSVLDITMGLAVYYANTDSTGSSGSGNNYIESTL